MTFPSIAAINHQGDTGSANTSRSVLLPSGIVAGNLLIVVMCTFSASVTITVPSGWTALDNTGVANNSVAVIWKIASGSEGSSVAVTFSASTRVAAVSYRITGYDAAIAPVYATTTGSFTSMANSTADPPSNSPGVTRDTLWLAIGFNVIQTSQTISALASYPTNYSLNQVNSLGGVFQYGIAAAARQLNAASENPGVFTFTNVSGTGTYRGITISVPAPADSTGAFFPLF